MKLQLPKTLLLAVLAAYGTATADTGYSNSEKTMYLGGAQASHLSMPGGGTITTETLDGGEVKTSINVVDFSESGTSYNLVADDKSGENNLTDAVIGTLTVADASTLEVGTNSWNSNRYFDSLAIEKLVVTNEGSTTLNVSKAENKVVINSIEGNFASISNAGTLTLGSGVNVSTTTLTNSGTLNLEGTHEFTTSGSVTGDGTVVILDGANVKMNTGNNTASIQTHISVKAGGTLTLVQGDALGWDYSPKSIVLKGESEAKQALVSVTGRQTTTCDITLSGYSRIEGGSIQLFGCNISASGTDNVITSEIQSSRYACEVNVSENGKLEFSGNITRNSNNNNADGVITKTGAGTVEFSGTDSHFFNPYIHSAGTTEFTGEKVHLDGGMTVTSGGVEFAEGVAISLGKEIAIGENGSVLFNGNTLSLSGLQGSLQVGNGLAVSQNGVHELSTRYSIATGNLEGISGTVVVGNSGAQEIVAGEVTGVGNYYVIAVDNTQYDKTAHNGIENFRGYFVTNGATFDLNMVDDGAGFQPDLYLDEGTTITHTGSDLGTGKIAILNATLAGDATVHAEDGHQFGMLRNSWNESKLMLGGHTLTKTGDGIFHLVNTTVSNGTIDVTAGKLLIESRTDYHANGTSFDNAIINLGAGGTLQINSMKDSAAVGELVSATTGSGQIELNTTATLTDTQSTKATGKLTINSGATLKIGASDSHTVDISSLKSVVLNGGTLRYQNNGGTIQGLSTTSAGGTFDMNDMGQVADAAKLVFSNTTRLDGQLTFKNTWNCQVEIETLGGSGNFVIDGANRQDTNVSTIYISGADAYTGEVQMINGASYMTLNVADNLGLNVKYRTRSGQADLSQIGSGNTIKLEAFAGSIKSGTVEADVDISNGTGTDGGYHAGAEILSATEGDKITYAGSVRGTGNYIVNTGDVSTTTEFTGDVSGWTAGHLRVASGSQNVTYTGDATDIRHEHKVDADAKLNLSMNHDKAVTVSSKIKQDEGTVNLSVANSHTEGTTFSNETNIAKATIEAGSKVSFSHASVSVDDVLVKAAAELSFSAVESLSVSTLEVQQGATVTVGTIENEKTLTVTSHATFSGGQVNANLAFADGAEVTLNQALSMGSSLSLGSNLTLSGDQYAAITSMTTSSEPVKLFTGVDTLTLGGDSYTAGSSTLDSTSGKDLSSYFGNVESGKYYLGYTVEGDVYAGLMVPEPATTTLSLLALAGLCARRRRNH